MFQLGEWKSGRSEEHKNAQNNVDHHTTDPAPGREAQVKCTKLDTDNSVSEEIHKEKATPTPAPKRNS